MGKFSSRLGTAAFLCRSDSSSARRVGLHNLGILRTPERSDETADQVFGPGKRLVFPAGHPGDCRGVHDSRRLLDLLRHALLTSASQSIQPTAPPPPSDLTCPK